MIKLKTPYLLFLGDAKNRVNAKTATGIATFSPDNCIGYCKLAGAEATLDNLPELSIPDAKLKGAKTFIIGLANSGGFIAENWIPTILEAIEAGMDIASGLHKKLEDVPEILAAAQKHNIKLHNVRHHNGDLPTGSGNKRSGKRILAVGTDCSTGKMYSSLTLHNELKKSGKKSSFVATGQTGILIAGSGISIDAVPADFISGAVETMSPDANSDHYYVIEGQGSLFHPSFAGVSLGLLHGSAADYIILCHDPKRPHMRHLPNYPMPDILDTIERNLLMGKLTNPNIKCIGICINSSQMSDAETEKYIKEVSVQTNLPVTDPYKFGMSEIIAQL